MVNFNCIMQSALAMTHSIDEVDLVVVFFLRWFEYHYNVIIFTIRLIWK